MKFERTPALCGLLAPVWFLVALVAFAAVHPGYSHFTKAVSELGAMGAPHALAWNVLGFGAVGMLIVVFAGGFWRQTRAPVAAAIIALSGLGFAAAGLFPADMSNMNADMTRLHILASLVSFAAFAAAVPAVTWRLWRNGGRGFATVVFVFGLAAVLSVLLREANIPPGLAQRINFLAYLAWIALVASGLIARRTATQ